MGHSGCACLPAPRILPFRTLFTTTAEPLVPPFSLYLPSPTTSPHKPCPPLPFTRWAQSWARPMREAGLRAEGVALRQARFVQLYAR